MKPHLRVLRQKPLDLLGLVRRQIVEHDMNLPCPGGSLLGSPWFKVFWENRDTIFHIIRGSFTNWR